MNESPRVEPTINEGIVDTVGHGQPVDAQVRDLAVRRLVDLRIVMRDQEVCVVRSPTNLKEKKQFYKPRILTDYGVCIYPENDHHDYHHFYNLKK